MTLRLHTPCFHICSNAIRLLLADFRVKFTPLNRYYIRVILAIVNILAAYVSEF